jgi:uncharacterized membrane protein YgcG
MVLDVIETHAKHAHRAAHHHLKKLVPGASGGMVIVCVALAIITCVAGVFWAYPNLMAPTKVRKVTVAEPPEHPLVAVAMGFSPGAIVGIFLVVMFVGGGLVYIVRFGSGLIPSNSAPSSACRVGGGGPAVNTAAVNAANGSGSSSSSRGASGASGGSSVRHASAGGGGGNPLSTRSSRTPSTPATGGAGTRKSVRNISENNLSAPLIDDGWETVSDSN